MSLVSFFWKKTKTKSFSCSQWRFFRGPAVQKYSTPLVRWTPPLWIRSYSQNRLQSQASLLISSRSLRRFPLPNRLLASLTPHENIYTLPNLLTFSRLLAAPAVGYLILHDHHVIALSLFVYAGITDLVDGWIARKYGLETVVGTVIDPMADKALMMVTTISLALKVALPGELSSGCRAS